MSSPKHPLAASEIVRAALANAKVEMQGMISQPGRPIISRVTIKRVDRMDDAQTALEKAVTNAGDVDKVGPRTFEITWP